MASFRDFGLSEATLTGLEENNYKEPTAIQARTIPLAVEGKDILGAARTGSGKTLAFLIPLLERLDALKWSKALGLGALIITPTRELAYQIYEVLCEVGKHHDFSAALIIGGKDLKFETSRLRNINIIIGTPGRICHHMDQNPDMDCSDIQMVVLDEADRLLDMGFKNEVHAIIQHLPPAPPRQTLLFSATQTRDVTDLACLSLTEPADLSADQDRGLAMPESLTQIHMVVPVEEKFNFLRSFIESHRQKKTMVFLASCKQVKFFNEVLCHLRPGVSVLALHGNQHQLKRMEIYDSFRRKEHAVLLCTDVCSRGLDFPKVDYVLQLDRPDDVKQYVHRAGRTARYNQQGIAVLLVTPAEEERFIPQLEAKQINISKMEPNQHHIRSVDLSSMLARYPALNESAQRCFKAYLKSLWMVHKLDSKEIDMAAFAKSLGLHGVPRVRFLDRHQKQLEKRSFKGQYQANLPEKRAVFTGFGEEEEEEEEDEPFLKAKRFSGKNADLEEEDAEQTEKMDKLEKSRPVSRAAVAKKLTRKGIAVNTKIKFDASGSVAHVQGPGALVGLGGETTVDGDDRSGLDLDAAKKQLEEADAEDRMAYRKRIKEKHKEERKKRKALRRKPGQPAARGERDEDEEEDFGVALASASEEDEQVLAEPAEPTEKPKRRSKKRKELESQTENTEAPAAAARMKRKKSEWIPDNITPISEAETTKTTYKKKSGKARHLKFDVASDENLALQLLAGV